MLLPSRSHVRKHLVESSVFDIELLGKLWGLQTSVCAQMPALPLRPPNRPSGLEQSWQVPAVCQEPCADHVPGVCPRSPDGLLDQLQGSLKALAARITSLTHQSPPQSAVCLCAPLGLKGMPP